MKALSVKPQWADLIRSGRKTLEIRSRRTHHRGPLLICATRPAGVASCIVELNGCRPFEPADADQACIPWQPNLWAWELANVRPVPPHPVKGQQSMFDVDLRSLPRPVQTQSPLPFAPAR